MFSYVRDGKDAEAVAAFDKLLTVFADQPTLSHEIYQVARRYDKAGKTEKALSVHQYNVKRFPNNIHAMWSQVEIIYAHISDGNTPATDAAFDKLISTFSDQPTLSKEVYEVAKRYSEAGNTQKARQVYQYLIEKWTASDDIDSRKFVIASHIALGNDRESQVQLDKLIADYSGHRLLPDAIFIIGQSFYNRAVNKILAGKQDQTIDDYRKAISIWERIARDFPDPNSTPLAYWCSAIVYSQELGEYQKGIDYYQHIIDNWPDYEFAGNAQFLIGKYYQRLKETGAIPQSQVDAKIEYAFQAVIDKYPNSNVIPQAALALAQLNFQKAQWLNAAKYFELFIEKSQAGSLDPFLYGISVLVPNALYNLGRSYENASFLEQATDVYKRLVSLYEPNDSYVHSARIRLWKLAGGTK